MPTSLLLIVGILAGEILLVPGPAARPPRDASDLAAIDTHIEARAADATIPPKLRKVYGTLGKAVRRPNPRDLVSREIAKMQAVAAALDGKLKDDRTLAVLLGDAVQKASDRLAELLDAVSIALGRIAKVSDRDKLERRALAIYGDGSSGRRIAATVRGLKAAGKLAKRYETLIAKAGKTARKQGGPTPETVTPEPQRVYTYAGSGEPGFNGTATARAARRSTSSPKAPSPERPARHPRLEQPHGAAPEPRRHAPAAVRQRRPG